MYINKRKENATTLRYPFAIPARKTHSGSKTPDDEKVCMHE